MREMRKKTEFIETGKLYHDAYGYDIPQGYILTYVAAEDMRLFAGCDLVAIAEWYWDTKRKPSDEAFTNSVNRKIAEIIEKDKEK